MINTMMTAKEIYEKVILDPMYATCNKLERERHSKLAQIYHLGEKAYYEKAKYDIVERLSKNDFFTTWVNNGYKNIFEGKTANNVFAWVDYFLDEPQREYSESENPDIVARLRKKTESRYYHQFIAFLSDSAIYYWLQEQVDLLTDSYADYFASRNALRAYEKVENQLIEKGYYDSQKGWLNSVVSLQALIKKLYIHHYFKSSYTGAANPYKKLYPFIEHHFHISVNQNFEKARMEKVEVLYYIQDIDIKPL